jgi:hypothetical protein
MGKITTGQAVDLVTMSQASAPIGEIKHSMLLEADFNDENLGTWYLLDGRSCVGTAYQAVSGENSVPDAITNGEFLRQAKPGRAVGTAEADSNKDHYHGRMEPQSTTTFSGNYVGDGHYGVPWTGWAGHTSYRPSSSHGREGAGESKPKNIAVNLYIKVEY